MWMGYLRYFTPEAMNASIVYTYEDPGLPRWCSRKESACQCGRHKRHRFNPWVHKILCSRKWQHTPVFLPGKVYEWRTLMGYCPCWHKNLAWLCTCTHVFHSVTRKRQFPSLKLLKFHFSHNISWEIKFRQKEAEQEYSRETFFMISFFLEIQEIINHVKHYF